MNIAIHISLPAHREVFLRPYFMTDLLPQLIRVSSAHRFFLILDGFKTPDPLPEGVLVIAERDKSGSPVSRFWWSRVTLPKLLRKHRIEAVLQVNQARTNFFGVGSTKQSEDCKRNTSGSFEEQRLFIYFENPEEMPGRNSRNFAKAELVFAGSEHVARRLTTRKDLKVTRVKTVQRPSLPEFVPVNPDARELVRQTHSSGRNYFFYYGPVGKHLLSLIKAFSIFKKRQKSDWKLLIGGAVNMTDEPFIRSLGQYRYRDDLVLLNNLNPRDLPGLISSAYALLFAQGQDPFMLPEVFASAVPVIAPDEPAFHGSWDHIVMYYEKDSQTSIAENMMTIYKDESKRSAMVREGRLLAESRTWEALARDITAGLE
ncbi:MAG: glycosyltransferase [Chitinophagaceae bacterium]